jgi:hypothetical protein
MRHPTPPFAVSSRKPPVVPRPHNNKNPKSSPNVFLLPFFTSHGMDFAL